MGKFGIGGARLAVDTGYPVIPVAHDAGHYWPKRGFLKKPGTIRMVIGNKIETAGVDAASLNQQLFEWMQQQMTKLEGKKPLQQDKK
jgi:1-acyl-sn-glycerol-3-phosphate acyltransferase